MQIDVVVPAYNAEPFIGECIEGLLGAGFQRTDITVVDDGSTDGTADVCRAFGIAPLVLGRNTCAAFARNAGAAAGTAEIVLFIDADVVVHLDARSVLEAFFEQNPDCTAVFGVYDDSPAAPGRVSRIRNLLHRHVHLQNAGPAVTFWSGCGAVRRTDFEALGGFDESLAMMEDVDLGLRISLRGKRIMLLPSLQGKHLKSWTLASVARTDLLNRAIPWARRLSQPDVREMPDTLNISAVSRVSVISVALSVVSFLLIPVAPAVMTVLLAAALSTLIVANAGFIRSLLQFHSVLDAVAAVPVLWLHYLCGGLGFAWVRLFGWRSPQDR